MDPKQDHPSAARKIVAYCALVVSTILVLAWPQDRHRKGISTMSNAVTKSFLLLVAI